MTKSLYERLGGRDGISNARFLPLKDQPEKLAVIKQHTIEFFSAGSGGPPIYTGRDMVTAHKGMNISPAEYMHAIDDIFAALDKNSIDEATKKDVLAILWSLKGMIVSQ